MSNPDSVTGRHGGAKVRLPPPLVFLGFALLGGALQTWGRRLCVPYGTWRCLAAAAVVGLPGLGLLVATQVLFRRSGQDPRPWKPSPSMILSGPYRFSRNPMYLGAVLFVSGLGLALNDLWVVLSASASLGLVHFTAVLPEEAYLSARFGKAYDDYRRRVRRYF